tara:strand:- start:1471 stop:1809 length:339 start_codon:yes stop_codon:yes gene_type:complete
MTSRYDNTRILRNNNPHYEKAFDDRGVEFIRQYETPRFEDISVDQAINLTTVERIWSVGDRYYNLAYEYYGNANYWWIIAWYNQAPTESHLELGDLIYIPMPLERALQYYGI